MEPTTILPTALLKEEQAAAVLNLTNPRTLAAWRLRRQGPNFVKIGSSVRYRLTDLLAYIESRTVRHPEARS